MEWDGLGIVIEPPTDVTCAATRNFQENIRVFKTATNKWLDSSTF